MNCETEMIMQDVVLTCLTGDKFKTSCLSVNLLTALCREDAAKNALIPQVLRRGTRTLPDMAAISAKLDGLYGAKLRPMVRKKGEIQVIGFYCDFADDKFLPGRESLLEEMTQLLGQVLLCPAMEGGLLRKEYVDSEKEQLAEKIRGRINDKRAYSIQRLLEQMCSMENYGADPLGTQDSAMNVTARELTEQYRQVLSQAPIEIFYCGSAPFQRVKDALVSALSDLERDGEQPDIGTDVRMNSLEAQPRYFTDHMQVTQGKLALGFRLGDCMQTPDPAAIRVFNAVFGGCVTSKLFMNVREKLSLCYFASSSCDLHKGVMLVSSGIEFDKYDDALKEILLQLENIKKGDVSDFELQAAQRSIAGDLRSIPDSAAALESFYLDMALIGPDDSPLELAQAVEQVTVRQLSQIAQGVELDGVYFLAGPEEGE